MISNIKPINNEITQNVMDLLKQNSLPTDEYIVQKIIYKTKMNLGNTHPLYEKLPYYWYYYGPFSETIRNSYNDIKNKKAKINTNILKKYPETTENITKIISKGDYVKSALCEDIYKNEVFIGNSDEYVTCLHDCSIDFPENSFFQDFTEVFSLFSMQLSLLNSDNLIAKEWEMIRKPIQNLWFTFAEGIRCQAHDNYYTDCYDNWNLIFNQSVEKLESEIWKFIDKTDSLLDLSKPVEIDEKGEKFLNTMITAYL